MGTDAMTYSIVKVGTFDRIRHTSLTLAIHTIGSIGITLTTGRIRRIRLFVRTRTIDKTVTIGTNGIRA